MKKPEYKRVTVVLDKETLQTAEELANRLKVNRSVLIRLAIKDYAKSYYQDNG